MWNKDRYADVIVFVAFVNCYMIIIFVMSLLSLLSLVNSKVKKCTEIWRQFEFSKREECISATLKGIFLLGCIINFFGLSDASDVN